MLQFRENVGHVFIESLPLFRLPETGLVDLSTVDALLLSNCFSALALPFLIEKYGFSGKIFATKPTVTFTKQLMEELSHYIYRAPPTDHSAQWKNDSLWSSLPDGTLKESSDFHNWKELYTMEGIQKAISRIQPISYSETIDLFHHVKVTALSSGFCLGSCNWIIETEYNKVAYISSSSTFTTHPCPMERARLKSADILIMSGLTNAPSANPDTMLAELCTRMAQTLKNGGNVLIPCYPTGVLYDLLECLKAYLDSANLSNVPVYFISPVAKSSLSFSNIFAEWLCDAKKTKVYLPEQPFPHAEFIKSGRLRHFPNIHGDLGSVYQTPCVVFTGHPSLRCGDSVHFMEAWGGSSKNAVIFTEPDFEYLHALAPYQPLHMKAYYFPIDPRLNFFVANKLLNEFAPRCLVTADSYLPSAAHSQKENVCLQPEMQYYGLTRGRAVTIPLDGKFQKIMLDPELASKLLPQEIFPGVSVTSVLGLLSSRNNQHTLAPLPPHHRPHTVGKLLWGELSIEAFVQALRDQHGIVDVVIEGTEEAKTLNILGGKATVLISPEKTTIRDCADDKLRAILRDLVFRLLVQV
ncbi:Integrator complex subunit 9 [Geodia barretti]|uniref:Integrator complex subunit 9 n=1 Tax=Geodia barretti TaxID=519541 RepID=A0AA35SWZ3_GEOBA|nr:Integrator complex subunit 9 [Geodia barretti]